MGRRKVVENLPRWGAEFGRLAPRIWKNFSREKLWSLLCTEMTSWRVLLENVDGWGIVMSWRRLRTAPLRCTRHWTSMTHVLVNRQERLTTTTTTQLNVQPRPYVHVYTTRSSRGMKVAWWRNGNLERWTYDQEVVDSTPGRVAIKWLLPEWTG